MQKTIQTLPASIINHISAGEVVERPSNLIKELIENSIDAGASKIEILFSQGGRFVQIKDDGCGIRAGELNLALTPHSTSKITQLNDIWSIESYGFRGEALASIAEVSDLTLISKPEGQTQSACIRSEFGKRGAIQQVGSEQGTTVIVQNLFQNTPARLKFLKSETAENTAIKNIIKAMALSHPSVEFKVRQKNKLIMFWPAVPNLQKRAEQVLSLDNTFYTKTQYRDIHVEAVLCAPNETAPNRRQMWFFVSNRYVEDLTLHSAVMSAYRGLLMHGEYPILALNLTCPKEDVDVNVHPAKSKVRFKNSSVVFKAVQNSLRAVLEKGPWLDHKLDHKLGQNPYPHPQDTKPDSDPSAKPQGFFTHKVDRSKSWANNRAAEPEQLSHTLKSMSMPAPAFVKGEGEPPLSPALQGGNKESPELKSALSPAEKNMEEQNSTYWSSLTVLAQTHLTYIVAQNRESVIFIDQHAAHERVLYERLMQAQDKGPGEVQTRLTPLNVQMEESLIKGLISLKKELLKIGLDIEQSGPEGLLVLSSPVILKDVALQKALVQLGEEMTSVGGSFAIEKHISHLFATMACHSAIRAGQALSFSEMKDLLAQMDVFPLSSFCPHGRPVFVNYPLSRLEKDFGRRA